MMIDSLVQALQNYNSPSLGNGLTMPAGQNTFGANGNGLQMSSTPDTLGTGLGNGVSGSVGTGSLGKSTGVSDAAKGQLIGAALSALGNGLKRPMIDPNPTGNTTPNQQNAYQQYLNNFNANNRG